MQIHVLMTLLAVPIKGLRQIKQSNMDSRTSLSSPSSSSLIVAVAVFTASAQLMLKSLSLGRIPPFAIHSYMKKKNVKELKKIKKLWIYKDTLLKINHGSIYSI